MITAMRRIDFCAGHRVFKHESKCAHLHGHNYRAEVYITATVGGELDGIGRVVDFSVIKREVGGWVDCHWDHGFILHEDDEEARHAMLRMNHQRLYLMPYNPTAENMARYLVERIGPQIFSNAPVQISRVDLWETPNCMASVKKVEAPYPTPAGYAGLI